MVTKTFDIGDKQRFTATFKDENGVLKDPTLAVATLREPDGTISTPSVANPSVGIHTVDLAFTQSGRHFLEFVGTGDVVSAQGTEFYILKRNAI